MTYSLTRFGCGALAISSAVTAATVALAQPASSAAASTDDKGIEEIVVRAQRVEQSLQKVPVAVTPVSARDLETKRLHDLPQLALAVPSLGVTTDNAFTLRGVGSQVFSANVDSSVGVMVDDVSLGVPIFMSNAAFLDMEQVEVLTGPQGLLFGRNASAGLMNIITKRPELNHLGGDVSLEYDGRDAPGGSLGIVGTGVLNLPTSGNSALRLNALESIQDPIAKVIVSNSPNLQQRQIRTMGKAKWLWEPTPALNIYLLGDYSRERGTGGIWDDSWRTTGAGGNDAANAAHDGVTPGPTNLYKGLGGANFRSVDTGGVSLNASDKLSGNLTLGNIFAWRAYTLSYNLDSGLASQSPLPINAAHQSYNQFSDELRLAFKDGRLDGQIGLYAFASNLDGDGHIDGAQGTSFDHVLYGNNTFRLSGRSLATYGQAAYHVSESFQLLAGARVTHDHVSVDAHANNYTDQYGTPCISEPFGPAAGFCLPLVAPFGPYGQNYRAAGDNTNFSYKLGAQYNVTPDTMVYLTWSTGYKGPAMQTNLSYAGQSPYLKPETVKDLEGGVKAMLLDRKLRINVAGFIETFKDFQTQSFANIPGAGGAVSQVSVISNAGGARTVGVEVNSTFKPFRALTFNYNANWQNSHFTDYATDPCYVGQTTKGCSSSQSFFQGAGIATSTAAHYAGTLEAVYAVTFGADRLELSGNWYHRSSINFTTSAAPYAELGAIDVLGTSLTWRGHDGLTVAVFCKNCANRIYPNYIGSDPGDAARGVLSTTNRWGYNSVRTIGASIGYKF